MSYNSWFPGGCPDWTVVASMRDVYQKHPTCPWWFGPVRFFDNGASKSNYYSASEIGDMLDAGIVDVVRFGENRDSHSGYLLAMQGA